MHVPPDETTQAPAGTDCETAKTAGPNGVGAVVTPQRVKPFWVTLLSVDQEKFEPAVTTTPFGLDKPLYAVPPIVIASKVASVDHSTACRVVVCSTWNVHRSLLP